MNTQKYKALDNVNATIIVQDKKLEIGVQRFGAAVALVQASNYTPDPGYALQAEKALAENPFCGDLAGHIQEISSYYGEKLIEWARQYRDARWRDLPPMRIEKLDWLGLVGTASSTCKAIVQLGGKNLNDQLYGVVMYQICLAAHVPPKAELELYKHGHTVSEVAFITLCSVLLNIIDAAMATGCNEGAELKKSVIAAIAIVEYGIAYSTMPTELAAPELH